ncbi:MAG: glycosyltransferase [Paenibacillus sp.]|nr:glycosyltransferase [Paenibacillus sp.]
MEILYVSRLCSTKTFDILFNQSSIKPEQQAQKFHRLLAEGFGKVQQTNITALSGLPISRSNIRQAYIKLPSDIDKDVTYKYIPLLNIPLLGHVVTFLLTFVYSLIWCHKNKSNDKIIICDVLNLTISVASKIAAFLSNVKTVGIVTDIPYFMQGYTRKRKIGMSLLIQNLYTNFCDFFLKRYDAYILLTLHMNNLVNPNNKPYIIIEGIVDSEMKNSINNLENKNNKKIVIYAGALQEKYGVKMLIESFKNLPIKESELWLFGSGELEKEMKNYELIDKRIKYFGVLPNNEIIIKEIQATLLVNPRPSEEEFTKYSFPSKNMEYMVSGTPILTTKLPGMPDEYKEFVYCFDGENLGDFTEKLCEILNKDISDLHEFGLKAKHFVLTNKNNIRQAEQLFLFFKSEILI